MVDPAATKYLTLEDYNTTAGTGLSLQSPNIVLMPGSSIKLRWDAVIDKWVEIARSVRLPTTQNITISDGDPLALTNRNVSTLVVSLTESSAPTNPAITCVDSFVDGQELFITMYPSGAFTLTLDDEGTTTGSALRLSATSLVLTPGSSVRLRYSAAAALWHEIGHTILV
jgi:hypothetical protein